MDLGFLYSLGYDYASTHLHPMANDGVGDYTALLTPRAAVIVPDATVVRNSILVQSMLVQEALNVSKMRWRAIVYDFLDQIRLFLGTGDPQFQLTMIKIGRAWPGIQLREPPTSKDGPIPASG